MKPDTSLLARFGVLGLTDREWVLLALEALDQADVPPSDLALAYRDARGDWPETAALLSADEVES